jgi:Leucine-rich repeat (LRR) protein
LEGKFHLTLFELEYLNYLDLSNNDFKAIHLPMDCQNLSLVKTPLHGSGNFSNVVHLDLSKNENRVIDDLRWLLRLSSSLHYLNMNSVNLRKETHWLQILTMFPSLSELYLSNCLLESVNPSLLYANFTSLEYLDLSCNYFISEFPIWLLNISGLSYLDLRGNRFHGQIPKTLLNLRNMDSLFLGDNMFSGKIPKCLGQLGGLKILGLSYNSFTGSIPTTLGNLSSLTVLRVASNHLTGTLPECFGQLSNLEELDVRGNNLSGVISKRNFAKLSNLQILSFGSPSFNFDFDPNWIPPFKLQDLVLEYVDLKLLPWFYTQTSLISIHIYYSLFKNVSQEMFWNLTTYCQFISLSNNTMPWDISNVCC